MKAILFSCLIILSGFLLVLSWNVFYGNHAYLSKQSNHYLGTIDTVIKRYYDQVSVLENKVYTSIRTEDIENFFKATLAGRKTRYSISFSDPFLINFYLLDKGNNIVYTYSPLERDQIIPPTQNGVQLLDQQTLAITSFLAFTPNQERVVFLFNLRKLFHELFAQTIANFNETQLTLYRYGIVYTAQQNGVKEDYLRSIEWLIDASYENFETTTVNERDPTHSNRLIGKKLSNGLLIGIFYNSGWGDIPVLSWLMLSTCLAMIGILSAYIGFYNYNSLPRSSLFIAYFQHLKHVLVINKKKHFHPKKSTPPPKSTPPLHHDRSTSPPSTPAIKSITAAEDIVLEFPADATPAPQAPVNTEILSLVAELKESPSTASSKHQIQEDRTSHIAEHPKDHDLSILTEKYPQIIQTLSAHAKQLVGDQPKLSLLHKLLPHDLTLILVLQKPKAYAAFEVSEFYGIDFSTAEELIISERERIFSELLARNKAIFIKNAPKTFFAPRLNEQQLAYLTPVKELLILPFKPKKNKNISTLILLG
ncbi:hypothetical protein COTS27_00049 [Spirochaetota bacterium]|nr:hypothetical protein COTS27_00049 [Spirochaetota bacterium]